MGWLIYALAASILWGVNYASSGRVLQRGMSVGTLSVLSFGFGAIVITLLALILFGTQRVTTEISGLGKNTLWLYISIISSTAAAVLTFFAIEGKNATVASMIEISYPLFVALFSWLFFRELELNWPTLLGGCIMLGGVLVVFFGNK